MEKFNNLDRKVIFDMQLPYIYMPDKDYEALVIKIANKDHNIECSYERNYCKYINVQNCSEISSPLEVISFEMNDGATAKNFSIANNQSKFLFSGSDIGEKSDECYLPIFRSMNGDQSLWYLGYIFLSQHYFVLDASPLDQNQNYLTVSIGDINPS